MTRHLEGLAAAGQFDGDPGLVGHMYWAALHGPIMLAFSAKLRPEYDARRLIAALMETLHRGLLPTMANALEGAAPLSSPAGGGGPRSGGGGTKRP
jgi:hypothetical protein